MFKFYMLPIAVALTVAPTYLERADANPLAPAPLTAAAPVSDVQPVYYRGYRGGYYRGYRGGYYRGGWRVGGRYYGGIWYGTGRRWYGGRWWAMASALAGDRPPSATFGFAVENAGWSALLI